MSHFALMPRAPRATVLAAALAISSWGLPAHEARASTTMVYGDLTVNAYAQTKLVFDVISDPPPTLLPNGDPAKVAAFAGHPTSGFPDWFFGGFAHGTPTRHPTQAFASAQMNGGAFADLGVSGVSEGPGVDAWSYQIASIIASQRVTNTGGAGPVLLSYEIPLIEIASHGTRFQGSVASVGAALVVSRFDGLGKHIETFDVFDYRLEFVYEKPPTDYAIFTYNPSEDLLRDSAGLVDVDFSRTYCPGCKGKSVAPFSVIKDFVIAPGDYLEYTYVMTTELITGREGGGHALYGDPFGFDGGGRNFFEFTGRDVPGAVGEPASWALFGLAGAALAWRRRRVDGRGVQRS